jgi:putative acetyltransferase
LDFAGSGPASGRRPGNWYSSEETATFLDALRADGCILGEWLAEDASGLVGHIVFSRVWLEQPDCKRASAAMLTPMAVRPDRRNLGIGTQLMHHALSELEANGEKLFFVLGHHDYYPRAGFDTALAAGVESPWQGNRAFMARARFAPQGRLVLPSVIAEAH